jgi:hypothetical protein
MKFKIYEKDMKNASDIDTTYIKLAYLSRSGYGQDGITIELCDSTGYQQANGYVLRLIPNAEGKLQLQKYFSVNDQLVDVTEDSEIRERLN